MYSIKPTDYGLKLHFKGRVELKEMKEWSGDLKQAIEKQSPGFGVLVDVRELGVISPEVIQVVVETQQFAKDHGTGRNANIVGSRIAKLQQTRMAKESGLYSYMRYIDASADNDPEETALAWIKQGTDPDHGDQEL